MVVAHFVERPVLSPVSGGRNLSDMFYPTEWTGQVGTESGDQTHCLVPTLNDLQAPEYCQGS